MPTIVGSEIDPGRLSRAVWLEAVQVGPGRYEVSGGSRSHSVDLNAAQGSQCDCEDHAYRGSLCKHLLTVMLREGDANVIEALRSVVDPS